MAVWFFGGAYVFGSKNEFDITKLPLYSGVGLLSATPEPLIFVAGNYRLGAFGWLAGSYLENNGAPNAGLLDQRMILQFVQKYISKVNGNPTSVSAWGESAGAGSILHHLVAANGQQDPLFSRAILQSPAYQWQWDRFGILNDTYTYFAKLAGCPTGDISCLQSTNQTALQTANQALFRSKYACQGIFPVGPSVDKSLIPTLPPVAFQNGQSKTPSSWWILSFIGQYWKNLDSIIISHVSDEVQYNGSFLPYPIRQNPTAANFDNFLKAFMFDDKLAALRSNIDAQYPVSKYKNDQIRRTGVVIRDASFTCNTRQLFDAYSGKINTYMMDYHLLGDDDKAVHGSDIIPTFVNNGIDVSSLLQKCYGVPWAKATAAGIYIKTFFAPAYQSYLKSFAIHKDPNLGAIGGAKKVKWTPAYTSKEDGHNSVRNVLLPYYAGILGGPDFKILPKDPNNTAASCTFWNQLATNITKIVGSNLEYPALRIQTGEESGRFDLWN